MRSIYVVILFKFFYTSIKYNRVLHTSMENTFVVKDEPITIRITIEVIPAKKKDIKEVPVVAPVAKPEGWDVIEPETPIVIEPVVVPVAAPEKKKRAYTKKTKEVVVPVEEEKKVEPSIEEKLVEVVPPKVETKPVVPANKVVARLAQMIKFFCKASGISTVDVTKKYLIEHGAADIIEGVTDDMVEEAIREVNKK